LSGRGLCDELITRPEESYRLCCVVVCDLETSRMGAPYIYDISRLRVKAEQQIYVATWNYARTFISVWNFVDGRQTQLFNGLEIEGGNIWMLLF